MNENIHFQQASLIQKARQIYERKMELKGNPIYSWFPKNILMIHHGFSNYVNFLDLPTRTAPHAKFLKGKTGEFHFKVLIHDELDYTSQWVYSIFDYRIYKCKWLRRSVPRVKFHTSVAQRAYSVVSKSMVSGPGSADRDLLSSLVRTVVPVESLIQLSPISNYVGSSRVIRLIMSKDKIIFFSFINGNSSNWM